MSSRRPRPSASARGPTQAQRLPPLPTYQPPAAPLNRRAINALENIPRSHDLTKLHEEQKSLLLALTTVTDEINDRAYNVKKRAKEGRQKVMSKGGDEATLVEQEDAAKSMSDRVDALTAQLEEKIRSAIDAQERVAALEKALEDVTRNVEREDGRMNVTATQSTLGASQFRSRGATGRSVDEDENDNEATGGVGVVTLLKRKADAHDANWRALPMRDRYGANNDYIGFRKVLHDAQNQGDNAPPVPHASTWFPDERSNSDPTGTQPDPDADSDIEIASERISTKCPITLVELKDALTTPCGHNFEASAIKEMIMLSQTYTGPTQRQGRSTQGVEKMIQCPETSCSKMVTLTTLRRDTHIRRKIQRLQAAKTLSQTANLSEDEEDAQPTRRRPQEISSSAVNTPANFRQSVPTNVKHERASGIPSGTQGTQIVDLEDDDEEEEEEEEEIGPSSGRGRGRIVDLEDEDDE